MRTFMQIAPTEALIVGVVSIPLWLCIAGVFDMLRRPSGAWGAIGQSRTLWVVTSLVLVVLSFVLLPAYVLSVVWSLCYLFLIRRNLVDAVRRLSPTPPTE